MPLIKARTERVKVGRLMAKLYVENIERLHAYAAMIGEPADYILNELVASLEKDKDYEAWRKEHSQKFAPEQASRSGKAGKKPRPTTLRSAVPA